MAGKPIKQQGVASLTVALSLIIAISLLSYAVAHTANTEQRMTMNEQLKNDSLQAAEAGLLFGLDWLGSERELEWIAVEDQLLAHPATAPALSSASQDSFAINIVFEARDENDSYIQITSEASAAHTPEVSTRLRLYAKPISILTDHGERAPPLSIAGCLTHTSGQPRLLPDPTEANPVSLAIAESEHCLNKHLVNLGTGEARAHAFDEDKTWETFFAISPGEFQQFVEEEQTARIPDSQRNYWLADSHDLRAGRWTKNLGSPNQPIILVMPAALGCPKFGGGTTLHGLVYIEGDCGDNDEHGSNSWGNVEIYGALVIASDSTQLSGNVRINHMRYARGKPSRILPPLLGAIPIPGTWSDL